MPETVGNEANHLTGTEPPQITLGINLFATQVPHEEDSFGSDYDADATYDETTGGNPGNPGAGNPGAGNPDDPVDIRVLGTGGFRGTNWNAAESGWNIREYLALPFDVEDPNMGTERRDLYRNCLRNRNDRSGHFYRGCGGNRNF